MPLNLENINFLDAGFALVIGLFLIRGFIRGMIIELIGLIGVVLAFTLSGRLYPLLQPHVKGFISNSDWATGVSYALAIAAILVAVSLAGRLLRKFMTLTFTDWLDHLMGGVTGGAKGLFFCAIALALITRFTPDAPFLKTSKLAIHIDTVTKIVYSFLPDFI